MDTKRETEGKTLGEPGQDDTIISIGLILRAPLEQVSELKKAIASVAGTEIVYQKKSIAWLEIIESAVNPRSERR